MARTKLVVFDLDGVLYDFDAARRAEFVARLTGQDAQSLHATIWSSEFERHAEADALQSGEGYLAGLNRFLSRPITRAEWIEGRRSAMQPRPAMLEHVRQVQERVAVAGLTNNGALVRETLADLVPELWRLVGPRPHASCEFGARKPDRAVFERLLNRYGLEAEEVAFVDDAPENISGARAAGLRAILFETEAQAIAAVNRLLAAR